MTTTDATLTKIRRTFPAVKAVRVARNRAEAERIAALPKPRPKRGYSTQFTPKAGDDGAKYLVDRIPTELWTRVRAKATREGLSLRALILTLLDEWSKK